MTNYTKIKFQTLDKQIDKTLFIRRIFMFQNKTILLGVCGGIAAYKIANLTSMLVKTGANVHVLMTQNATNFINPITFESLTGNKCLVDTFDRNFQFQVEHVSIAKLADVFLIAPATANVIAKLAHGIADDMLTTTALACRCKKIVAPAMNTAMYENPITQDNLNTLKNYDFRVVDPDYGYLACGDTGAGKMPSEQRLFEEIEREIAFPKDMLHKKVLVTAGPTREAIDPVRFITNHSSGKMGYAIAKNAMLRGADVTLITGPTSIAPPSFVNVIPVTSAKDMFDAVSSVSSEQDIIIKAAAVADYTPKNVATHKIKKKDDDSSLELCRTTDILQFLGDNKKEHQFLCGFSMETENLIENTRKKLEKKHLDLIAGNSLTGENTGFQVDTNQLVLISKKEEKVLDMMSKEGCAKELLDCILEMMGEREEKNTSKKY